MLYHTTHPQILDLSFSLRQQAIVTLKACLYAYREDVRITKNICLTLRRFYSDLELAPYAPELCELLLNTALLHTDSTIRWCACTICCHDLASLSPSVKRDLVARNAIEKVSDRLVM
jgi:hypothetical protein